MNQNIDLSAVDPEIVSKVEKNRREIGHFKYKKVYPDTVVS